MTKVVQQNGAAPRTWAILIWGLMSLCPLVFFLLLLSAGVWALGVDEGWWIVADEPPSLTALLIPHIAVLAAVLAQIAAASIAYAKRGELAGTLFETHTASALRTFKIMLAVFACANGVALLLLLVPNIDAVGFGVGGLFIMAAILPLLFLWESARIVRGLRCALNGEPIAE